MANLTELSEWVEGLYRLETTDPVVGGEDGIDNLQAKQLGARTRFLKALVESAQGDIAAHEAAGDPHPQYLVTAEANALIAAAVAALVNSSPAALDTLAELATALGNDANFAATITGLLAAKAPLASPELTGVPTVPTAAGGTSTTQAASTAFVVAAITAAIAAQPGVATGSIIYVPATAAPTGYLKSNGALVSRATYANLWSYAQDSGNLSASDGAWAAGQFSPGDGATTFRIPDLRGEFIRSLDDGRGVDSGRAIGSAQADDFKSHAHGVCSATNNTTSGSGNWQPGANTNIMSGATGGTETRPRNVALLGCIKY